VFRFNPAKEFPMSEQPQVPEWIYPGAKVIVLVDSHTSRDDPRVYAGTVGKIAKLSFLVTFGDDQEVRINLKDLKSTQQGSTWSRWYYRVINLESVEAQRLREIKLRNRSRNRMLAALQPLTEVNSRGQRDDLTVIREAIVALSKHADLVLEQDTARPIHRSGKEGLTRCGKPRDDYPHYVIHIDEGVTCADCKEATQ
jgi:hypothetical protein